MPPGRLRHEHGGVQRHVRRGRPLRRPFPARQAMRTWRGAGRVTGQRAERETELAVTLWQDPLWRHVLCRAVIHYLEANRQGRDAPSFLAVKRLS